MNICVPLTGIYGWIVFFPNEVLRSSFGKYPQDILTLATKLQTQPRSKSESVSKATIASEFINLNALKSPTFCSLILGLILIVSIASSTSFRINQIYKL